MGIETEASELKELTKEEYHEMLGHLMFNDSIEEIEKDLHWHKGVLEQMSEGDPVRRRFSAIVESNNRILYLKRRFNEHGAEHF